MGIVVDIKARRDSRTTLRGPAPLGQPHTVRLLEPAERAYWCRRFNATVERLASVVREVGSNPAIVQLYLYRR